MSKLPPWLTVAVSTVLGAAIPYALAHDGQGLVPAAVGGLLTGVVALIHLYLPVPGGAS